MPPLQGEESTAPPPAIRRAVTPRYATAREILALALTGALLGVLLLATLIAIFPAAIGATTAGGRVAPVPLLFGLLHADLGPDTALLLLVVLSSAAGSFVHVATSFANYAGRNRLETSWLAWYALRGIIGAALAIVFYFVLRAGFFSGDATNASVNAYGIAAVAGFVGLFSRQATDKLRELFDTLFKTDSTEEEVDPVIHVVSPDPAVVKGTDARAADDRGLGLRAAVAGPHRRAQRQPVVDRADRRSRSASAPRTSARRPGPPR